METMRASRERGYHNKKKGRKSEVYALELEDMKKILSYFEDNEMWLQYMLFVMSCNLARRASDMLELKWSNFFNPNNGKFRSDTELQEKKTGKLTALHINSACRKVIELYIKKTGCDVAEDNFSEHVFKQLSGKYKGRVLSYSGYLKSLKRAANASEISDNIGTHSARKTFGMIARTLHPNDKDSMELLQTIYNHSSEKTTSRYIGLTKKKVDVYYDDMGDFFSDYVMGDKEFISDNNNSKFTVNLDINELRNVIIQAFVAGKANSDNSSLISQTDIIDGLMKLVMDAAL